MKLKLSKLLFHPLKNIQIILQKLELNRPPAFEQAVSCTTISNCRPLLYPAAFITASAISLAATNPAAYGDTAPEVKSSKKPNFTVVPLNTYSSTPPAVV